jgi:hypothetical protein
MIFRWHASIDGAAAFSAAIRKTTLSQLIASKQLGSGVIRCTLLRGGKPQPRSNFL